MAYMKSGASWPVLGFDQKEPDSFCLGHLIHHPPVTNFARTQKGLVMISADQDKLGIQLTLSGP